MLEIAGDIASFAAVISLASAISSSPSRLSCGCAATRLLEAAANGGFAWLGTEGVRLFHPTGQMVAPVRDAEERVDTPEPATTLPTGATRVALLDGIPMVGHA